MVDSDCASKITGTEFDTRDGGQLLVVLAMINDLPNALGNLDRVVSRPAGNTTGA